MYVHGGYSSNPYVNMNNPSAGMVRFDGTNFQVYDGSGWMTISGSVASVGMNPNAESAIDWAIRKMSEEAEVQKLAEDHPAVKIALENLNKAKQQLDATIILSKEHEAA
jgi:hypothetical protein